MFILDATRVKQHGLVVVVLHKLLHLCWQVGNVVAADGVHAHRLGQSDEIRVGHLSVRVALLVEEVCCERVEREEGRGGGKRSARRSVKESKAKEARELTLPLQHHTLELVVEDEDLDSNVVLAGGSELHGCHREGSVSVNVDDNLLGRGDLGSDGGRESETHGLWWERGEGRVSESVEEKAES